MKRKITVLIGILIALAAWKAIAQPCSALKGIVKDVASGEPLPGASIRNIQLASGTATDFQGSFALASSNRDTLHVSFIGYESVAVSTNTAKDCFLIIELVPADTQMEVVIVKAERLITEEFTIRKISKLDIYTNPSAKADPLLAVNSTPSATTLDESANISLRGGSPDETGVFLNNVPIQDAVRYSQMNGIGTFSIFNTALVKNVQVYPGNPPLEFGNSTSGLIAIQTDEEIPEYNLTTYSITMANLGFYTNRRISPRSSLSLFSNYQPSVLLRALNKKSLADVKSFSSLDLGLHYLYQFKNNAMVKVFNYILTESYQYSSAYPTYTGIFNQEKTRNYTVANFRKRIHTVELSVNTGLSFSRARYQYSKLDMEVRLDDFFTSLNVQQAGENIDWKTGFSIDHKGSKFNGVFPTYYYAVGDQYPYTAESSQQQITNPEWYGYIKKYFGSKWIGGIGVRKNIPLKKLDHYLSVQANANYKPTENWSINLAVGQYNKYQLAKGENINPILFTSRQISVDLLYRTRKFDYSTSLFYKTNTAASKSGTVKGVELFANYRALPSLRFQLSLTSLNAVEKFENFKKPSPYNIHYFLRGNVEYKIAGTWTATAVFLFRQGSYYLPIESTHFDNTLHVYEPIPSSQPERLPSYNTIDVSINKLFLLSEKATAIAFASIGNILNFKNVRGYTYNVDYTQQEQLLFSLRTIYFGLVINVNRVPGKK